MAANSRFGPVLPGFTRPPRGALYRRQISPRMLVAPGQIAPYRIVLGFLFPLIRPEEVKNFAVYSWICLIEGLLFVWVCVGLFGMMCASDHPRRELS